MNNSLQTDDVKDIVKKSGATLLYTQNNHYCYNIKWLQLSPYVKKWSRNRDPDGRRIGEILNCYETNSYVPRIVHLACLVDEGLVCYDGNHRRLMFDMVNDSKMKVIVDIIYNASQEDVVEACNNINKSIQLPIMYLEASKIVKDEIVAMVDIYAVKYKSFVSTSTRCQRPNFNKNQFVENVYEIYIYFDSKIDLKNIKSCIDALNIAYSKEEYCQPHDKYPPNAIKKCSKYNFWLFLEKSISPIHIAKLLPK